MKNMYRFAAIVVLSSGCDQSANVGDVPCSAGADCQELELSTPLTLTPVRTADAVALAPSWTRSEFAPSAPGSYGASLATASEGGLWLFRGASANLIATRIDADGRVLGELRIDPPAGLSFPSNGAFHSSQGATNHALGPVLPLDWATLCPKQDGPLEVVCPHSELLVFGNDTNTPIARVDASAMRSLPGSVRSAYRSAGGDTLFVPLLPDEIRMVDLSGKKLWTVNLTKELGHDMELWNSTTPPSSSGAVDADGALVLSPMQFQYHDPSTWVPVPGVLLRQPAAGGAPTLDRYLAAEPQPPGGLEVKQGSQGGFALDAQNRRLLVNQLEGGDLSVLRIDGLVAEGFRVLREDYLDLGLGHSAVDPAGTLHVSLNSGGRTPAEQRALLCSFPMQGTPVCSQIPSMPLSLQAPAAGKVYAATAEGLMRFDR